jgi:molybdopterin-guanine dinucleotide biosynthesis protein A
MISIAIMAGGKSSRMGQNKSFVTLNGRALIEHVLERARKVAHDDCFIVTNTPEQYAYLGLPMVADHVPDSGSLGGIYTAIAAAAHETVLVVATDMPFVNTALLDHLVQVAQQQAVDVVVPRVDGYPEGLCAVYRKTCLLPIRERIDAGRLKVIGFYEDVRVYYVDPPEYTRFDPQGLSFMNINTPEELQQAQRIAQGE